MVTYISTLTSSAIMFPFVALIISLPIFVYQYRRYGAFLFFRALVIYSFVFYLTTAYFMVILPLPSIESVAELTSPWAQLVPFNFVIDFLDETTFVADNPSTWITAIEQSVVFQPVFNIALVLPFGIYLRYYFGFSFKKTALFSFFLSLFFELTQLSGLYGIYPRPYRLFDVDDLMMNTLGGIVGYAIAPIFMAILPSQERLDRVSEKRSCEVGFFRRLTAFIVDWIAIVFASTVISYVVNALGIVNALESATLISAIPIVNGPLSQSTQLITTYVAAVFIYFILIGYLTNGQTIGKYLVRIRVAKKDDTRVPFHRILLRYLLLYYIEVPLVVSLLPLLSLTGSIAEEYLAALNVVIYFVAALVVVLILHAAYEFISRKRRLLYERISGTLILSKDKGL